MKRKSHLVVGLVGIVALLSACGDDGVVVKSVPTTRPFVNGYNIKMNSNLTGANLANAQLQKRNLSGATLDKANLSSANLSGANLKGASLNDANLIGANLSNANLVYVQMSGTYLSRANLKNVNLRGADLQRSNLTGANLKGANLVGANLDQAIFSDSTVWPQGFTPPLATTTTTTTTTTTPVSDEISRADLRLAAHRLYCRTAESLGRANAVDSFGEPCTPYVPLTPYEQGRCFARTPSELAFQLCTGSR